MNLKMNEHQLEIPNLKRKPIKPPTPTIIC